MQIWQLFIVLKPPVDIYVKVFSSLTKLSNYVVLTLEHCAVCYAHILAFFLAISHIYIYNFVLEYESTSSLKSKSFNIFYNSYKTCKSWCDWNTAFFTYPLRQKINEEKNCKKCIILLFPTISGKSRNNFKTISLLHFAHATYFLCDKHYEPYLKARLFQRLLPYFISFWQLSWFDHDKQKYPLF